MMDLKGQFLDLAGRSGLSDEEKNQFDALADQFGEQGITLDYDGDGNPLLRVYDDQDDLENDVFPMLS